MKGNEFSKSFFITAGSGTFGLYVYSCCMNYILVNSPFTYRSRHVTPNHVSVVERAIRTIKTGSGSTCEYTPGCRGANCEEGRFYAESGITVILRNSRCLKRRCKHVFIFVFDRKYPRRKKRLQKFHTYCKLILCVNMASIMQILPRDVISPESMVVLFLN